MPAGSRDTLLKAFAFLASDKRRAAYALTGVCKMAGKPLDVKILVRKGVETVPFETLTAEEKRVLCESLNRRAICAIANLRGYDVKFMDSSAGGDKK